MTDIPHLNVNHISNDIYKKNGYTKITAYPEANSHNQISDPSAVVGERI